MQRAVWLDMDDASAVASLARLHDSLGAGVSARLPWLQAWRDAYPAWRPWVLSLAGNDGELRAVAPLARRNVLGGIEVASIGRAALQDGAPVVHRTDRDGVELSQALAAALRSLHLPWTLLIHEIQEGSAFVAGLQDSLNRVVVRSGAIRPTVSLHGTVDPRVVMSRNLRQAESKARNRAAREGLAIEQKWIADPAEIRKRIPEMDAVYRARDIQLRGFSPLDHPKDSIYHRALRLRFLEDMELLELRCAGELAAYVLWIKNGRSRAVFDNRVSPRFTRISAGLIANNVALRTAAGDPEIDVLDWGSGVQRYKLQSATEVIRHVYVSACSSPVAQALLALQRGGGRARRRLAGALAVPAAPGGLRPARANRLA
jgi:hypothetical protein